MEVRCLGYEDSDLLFLCDHALHDAKNGARSVVELGQCHGLGRHAYRASFLSF